MKKGNLWLAATAIAVILSASLLGGIVSARAEQPAAATQGDEISGGTTPAAGGGLEAAETPDTGRETGENALPVDENGEGADLDCWCKKGNIFVFKFLDKDGDGNWDRGEPGIPGITFTLNGGSSRQTDSSGWIFYRDLPAGKYVVEEVVPAGYTVTTPNPCTVNLGKGETVKLRFGNVPKPPCPGSISGHKYEDKDGDGALDEGEPPVSGVPIELHRDGAKVAETVTGPDGSYRFEGLEAGTYTVREVCPQGMTPTAPESRTVDLSEGQNVTGVDFFNKKEEEEEKLCRFGKVEVLVFEDSNCNETLDCEDELISIPVQIQLYHVMGDGSLLPADGWDGPYQKPTGAGPSWWPVYPRGCASWMTLPCNCYDWSWNPLGENLYGRYRVRMVVPEGWYALRVEWGGYTYTDDFGPFELKCIYCFPTCWWQQVKFLLSPKFSVSGHKYEDLDGDGALDEGEPPVSGVPIELYRDGTKVAETVTGPDGSYRFDDLEAGTYTVREVLPAGWFATYPSDASHDGVVLTYCNPVEGLDFLNRRYASLRGFKYLDLDEDGVMDGDEEGLDGVTILLNDGERSTVTAGGGQFSFDNLVPGTYKVSVDESSLPGYYPTGPVSVTVDLAPGEVKLVYFGNAPYGSISGHKWLDIDRDGVWDAEETEVVPGITIKLYRGGPDGELLATAVTGEDGSYSFTGLKPDTYTVTEEGPDGYFATTPFTVTVDLSAGEGEVVDFGNCPYGWIEGLKFEDRNGNGTRDEGEPGLEGVEITLTPLGGGTAIKASSADDGTFSFLELLPGRYTLRETVPSGYYATLPTEVELEVLPGAKTTAIFANAPYGSITAYKWIDDGDKAISPGDKPGAGFTIKLQGKTADGEPVVSEPVVLGSEGMYTYLLMEAGTYTVSEEFDTSKYEAVSETSKTVELAPGQQAKVEFLNAEVEVRGIVIPPPQPPAPVVSPTVLPATGMDQLALLVTAAAMLLLGILLLALGMRARREA